MPLCDVSLPYFLIPGFWPWRAQLLGLCNRLTKPEASVKEMWLTYTKNDELHGEKNPDFIKGDVFNEHEGCRKLFAALTKNSSLTFLSMAKKGIRDEGCVYVADCLKKNKTLKCVHRSCVVFPLVVPVLSTHRKK